MRCRGYMETAGRVVTTTAYAVNWRGQPGGRTSTGRRSGAHQTCLGRPTVHWSPSGVNEYLEAFPHLIARELRSRQEAAARHQPHIIAPQCWRPLRSRRERPGRWRGERAVRLGRWADQSRRATIHPNSPGLGSSAEALDNFGLTLATGGLGPATSSAAASGTRSRNQNTMPNR
jgi:hypothetical protein